MPGSSAVTRSTLRQQIADALRDEVLSGRLEPGQEFTVKEIAEQYGVSATPVREALVDLAAQGLLDSVQHRGFCVHEFSLEDYRGMVEARSLIADAIFAGVAARGIPAPTGEIPPGGAAPEEALPGTPLPGRPLPGHLSGAAHPAAAHPGGPTPGSAFPDDALPGEDSEAVTDDLPQAASANPLDDFSGDLADDDSDGLPDTAQSAPATGATSPPPAQGPSAPPAPPAPSAPWTAQEPTGEARVELLAAVRRRGEEAQRAAAAGDLNVLIGYDLRFWREVSALYGNPYLADFLGRLRLQSWVCVMPLLRRAGDLRGRLWAGHTRLAEALARRDARAVHALITEYNVHALALIEGLARRDAARGPGHRAPGEDRREARGEPGGRARPDARPED